MALAMPMLKHDPKSGRWQARKVVPEDVRHVLGRREFKRTWLASLTNAEAKVAYCEWLRDVETKIAAAKRGRVSLSDDEIKALASRWYREERSELEAGINDPPEVAEAVLEALHKGQRDFTAWTMMRDTAAHLLQGEGIEADDETRDRLTKEIHRLFIARFQRERQLASRDFGPDPAEATLAPPPSAPHSAAATQPPPAGATPTGKALKLSGLFDRWAEHEEQRHSAAATIKRYRAAFKAVVAFLNDPAAEAVTTRRSTPLSRQPPRSFAQDQAGRLQGGAQLCL